jgi:hypothetical protein
MMAQYIEEKPRKTPVVKETEVLVVGGGPGGFAAAVAAGRAGAKVTLVERYGHLGGLATGGLVIWFPGFHPGGSEAYGGIPLEWVERSGKLGGAHYRHLSEKEASVILDPEMLKFTALDMVEGAGVDLVHHAWAVDTVVEEGRCRGVIMESKSGRQAILAQTVVDGTGDGDLVAWSGGQFTTNHTGIALDFRLGGVDWGGYERYIAENKEQYSEQRKYCENTIGIRLPQPQSRDPHGFAWCNSWGPLGYSAIDVNDLSTVERRFRRSILEAISYMRANLPGMQNIFLLDTASQIGTRDSRRIVASYQICDADMDAEASFPDSIGQGAKSALRRPIYDIPYRVIVPLGVDGLLVSGRCASTADDAYEKMRLIPPCLVLGQAAGAAAALASQAGVTPAKVNIEHLQRVLRSQGVPIGATPQTMAT